MATRTPPRCTTRPRSPSRRSGAGAPPEPFTVDHFCAWAADVVLDDGLPWEVRPFQREILADVFELKPEVWAVVPEGSGKSTMLAGLALYYGDHVPQASVLLAAAARHQARIMLRQAAGMVRSSPRLQGRFECLERTIRCARTGGELELFAADDNTGDGVLPDFAVIDEPHRLKDLRLYRTWRGKLQKRQGQLVAISTAGEPGSEFEEVRQRMRRSASARTVGCHLRAEEGGMVLHDWSVPTGADVWDLDLVLEANPLATRKVLEEKRDAPTQTEGHWRRFVCNQAVRSEESAIAEAEWETAREWDLLPDPKERCTATLDVGWKWDTTAVVPLFDRPGDGTLVGFPTVLEPPRDGTSLSPESVRQALRDLHGRHPYELLVMDGAAGGEQLAEWAEEDLGVQVIVHSNGVAAQALAFLRWMEALREGRLRHVGDPELTRHVLNAVARVLPRGDHRFDRPSGSRAASLQDRRVIDCLSAASAGLSVLMGMRQDVPAPLRLDDYRIGQL